MPESTATLATVLHSLAPVAIAVSGGIDSLTLASFAHRTLGPGRATMHHATSPAVPAEATERTAALAARHAWSLDIFDAGEFADPSYRANPINRCFFCKTSLYAAIAARTPHQILSGTNTGDLGEYRPGLDAARAHHVRHPFVEAGFDKPSIRRLAAELGLGRLAALPAAPCLASRVETGIRIEGPILALVHATENLVAATLSPATIRCRIRRAGIVIELDEPTLHRLSPDDRETLAARIAALAPGAAATPIAFAVYRTGSAFLHA
jgi:uncharacterized protein